MTHLTTRQIKQLIEIDNAGKGIRDEVQALIARLTYRKGVGINPDDPRQVQAKRLYDKGFGGDRAFAQYLATIPPVPEFPEGFPARFPELVLVDTRLSITKICELLRIEFPDTDETYVDFDPKTVKTDKVYWIRMQDGKRNKGKSVQTCREFFAEDEVGLSVYEGLAYFVQNPKSFEGRFMDLPGSVYRDSRDGVACLHRHNERPWLGWYRGGNAGPSCGSASRIR